MTLASTLHDLEKLSPSFVSVTYRGGRESRQRTFDLVTDIEREGHLVSMAHLICVGHGREEMREILENYQRAGVVNVMALGGDIPDDPDLVASEFRHAIDLVDLAREVGDFSIGVAAHPLGHPRSPDLRSDRLRLAEKLRRADFAVTQFFFELGDWTRLVDELAELGVTKPVLPGIMPVTTLQGAARMAQMGAAVPTSLLGRLEAASISAGPAAVRSEGVRAAGLHFYTLNRSTATREIHESLYAPGGVRRP